ncbi:hypothetical protein BX257_8734 [Streptomyces sp. 3212.3]|nr:hypothetical protein BX257_8734 [Streptomyces sp. 3212.3]
MADRTEASQGRIRPGLLRRRPGPVWCSIGRRRIPRRAANPTPCAPEPANCSPRSDSTTGYTTAPQLSGGERQRVALDRATLQTHTLTTSGGLHHLHVDRGASAASISAVQPAGPDAVFTAPATPASTPAPRSSSRDVSAPVEYTPIRRPGRIQGPTTRTVPPYLRAQGDTFSPIMRRPARDIQEQTVQRARDQLRVHAPVPWPGVLVVGPVDPAPHELQLIHAPQGCSRHRQPCRYPPAGQPLNTASRTAIRPPRNATR